MAIASTLAAVALALAAGGHAAPATAGPPPGWGPAPACAAPDLYTFALAPTAHANGASATARLRFAASPFGVAVTRDGRHTYALTLETRGLRNPAGTVAVVWAATPELDRVERLGTLDASGALRGRVAMNKFLLFVTAEASADVERWSGPILLRGIAPSGRMHSMAGHGPFEGEPCGALPGFR